MFIKVTVRNLHLYLGIAATLILSVMAISGFILSTKVIIENFEISSQNINGESLQQLLNQIEGKFEEVDSIKKTDSGAFIIKHRENSKAHTSYLNIHTGEIISEVETNLFYN